MLTMTASAKIMPNSFLDRLITAVKAAASDILASSSGFGHNDFVVDEAGDLVPQGTTITHQPGKDERDDEAFVRRLKETGQWRHGDAVQIVYNNRKIQVVRITRNPPRADTSRWTGT